MNPSMGEIFFEVITTKVLSSIETLNSDTYRLRMIRQHCLNEQHRQISRINLYRGAIDFAGGALLKRNNNKYLCIYKILTLPRPTVKHHLYKLVLYQLREYPP